MEPSVRRAFASLWLLLATGIGAYTSWYWSNTALDISAFSGEGRILALEHFGYAFAGYALVMAFFYWYLSRLDHLLLNCLHLLGTIATAFMSLAIIDLALSGGLPNRYYGDSVAFPDEITRQQVQLLLSQVRPAIFLFAVSQLMFVINLSLTRKSSAEDDLQKMLDEL